jgi:hypothetical protein
MSSTKNTDTDTDDDAVDRVLKIAEQNYENIQLAAVELGCEDELDLSVTPRGSDSSKSFERVKAAYLTGSAGAPEAEEMNESDETAADLTASLMLQNASNLQKLTDEGLGLDVSKTAGGDPLAQTKRAFFGV